MMEQQEQKRYGASYREIAEELFGHGEPKIAGVTAGVINAAESRLRVQLPAALGEYY